jgi:serine/threonine protein kinase
MMPGSQLGAYQVVAQLGAGGMGEVLRARDRRLNRDVAVKVLPTNFARDVERLCRCGQEARTFAVSSHPHVLTVHHAGVHDGVPCPASKRLTTLREEMNGRAFPGAKRSLQEYRK